MRNITCPLCKAEHSAAEWTARTQKQWAITMPLEDTFESGCSDEYIYICPSCEEMVLNGLK